MNLNRTDWHLLRADIPRLQVKLSRTHDDHVVFHQSGETVTVSLTHLREIVEAN